MEEKIEGEVIHVKRDEESDAFLYGFILADDPSMDDIFVHPKDIEPNRSGFKQLKKGERVRFLVKSNPEKNNRLYAADVEIIRPNSHLYKTNTGLTSHEIGVRP